MHCGMSVNDPKRTFRLRAAMMIESKRDAPMAVKDWLPAEAPSAVIDHKLKAGESLFRLGDKTVGLCEVVTGRVRLARVDRAGREIVLHVAGPGETLAEASLFK